MEHIVVSSILDNLGEHKYSMTMEHIVVSSILDNLDEHKYSVT